MSNDKARTTKSHNEPRLYLIESEEQGGKRYLVASVIAELRADHSLLSDELVERSFREAKNLRIVRLPDYVPWTNGNLHPSD